MVGLPVILADALTVLYITTVCENVCFSMYFLKFCLLFRIPLPIFFFFLTTSNTFVYKKLEEFRKDFNKPILDVVSKQGKYVEKQAMEKLVDSLGNT